MIRLQYLRNIPTVVYLVFGITFLFSIGYSLPGIFERLGKEKSRVELHSSIVTSYTPSSIVYDPEKDVSILTSVFNSYLVEVSKINKTDCSFQEAAINTTRQKLKEMTYQHNNCSLEINRLNINITLAQQALDALSKECRQTNKCPPCQETKCEQSQCPQKPCNCEQCPEPLPPCPQSQTKPCSKCDPPTPAQPCEVYPPCPACKPKECPKHTCPPEIECPPQPQPQPCVCDQCEEPHICPVPEDPICPPPEQCPEPTPCPKPDCPTECQAETARIQQLTTSLTNLQTSYSQINQEKEDCLRADSEGDCKSKTDALYQQLVAELSSVISEIDQSLPQSAAAPKLTTLSSLLSSIKAQLQQKSYSTTAQVTAAYQSLLNELLSQLVKLHSAIPALTNKNQRSEALVISILNQLDICEQKLRSL